MAVEAQYHHLFNRNIEDHQNPMQPVKRTGASPFFLDEQLSSQIQTHMFDIDCVIRQHVASTSAELSQRRQVLASELAVALSKRLKCKDEEIEQLKRMNWEMQERINNLLIESNAWMYLAQSHEAATLTLRQSLERVLAERESAVGAEDAASCCGGDGVDHNNDDDDDEDGIATRWRVCRGCGQREPSVLVLPCRHLCLCSFCGPRIEQCPVCGRGKTGSVNVNLC